MSDAERGESADPVLDVVVDILNTRGYDAVRVREVARRSRVSSKTIYQRFETREHLIAAALQRWTATNVYVNLTLPEAGESVYDVVMRSLRALFEPWERNPRMLEAYHRARLGPAGAQLGIQGTTAARRVGDVLFMGEDADLYHDLEEILANVVAGLISRFVHGDIGVEDIVPGLEVAVARLTRTSVVQEP